MDLNSADSTRPSGTNSRPSFAIPVRSSHPFGSLLVFSAILLAIAAGFLILAKSRSPLRKPAGPPPESLAGSIPVQNGREASLAAGKLLVADTNLRDPNFAGTVILLVSYNERGAMGILINHALTVKLSEVLPNIPGLENRRDTLYYGGPVERGEILMLIRAKEKPEDSRLIFGDVYLSASADLLRGLTGAGQKPAAFRVYSGYAGWGPSQLDAEVIEGSWHIFPATAETVFATRPEDLWEQFIHRATIRLAKQLRPHLAPQWPEILPVS